MEWWPFLTALRRAHVERAELTDTSYPQKEWK